MTGRGAPLILFTLLALLPLSSHSQQGVSSHGHQFTQPDSLNWVPSGGVQLAVLSGDPDKPGLFTIRLKVRDGYRVQAHWHPQDESITVIQGTFLMGMGDKFDPAALEQLPTGSFAFMPKEMRHFASCIGETIVQLHGMGPFVSNYVNPADDPDKKKP
jgi:quercetin dioxygenase-like cupin family protein